MEVGGELGGAVGVCWPGAVPALAASAFLRPKPCLSLHLLTPLSTRGLLAPKLITLPMRKGLGLGGLLPLGVGREVSPAPRAAQFPGQLSIQETLGSCPPMA